MLFPLSTGLACEDITRLYSRDKYGRRRCWVAHVVAVLSVNADTTTNTVQTENHWRAFCAKARRIYGRFPQTEARASPPHPQDDKQSNQPFFAACVTGVRTSKGDRRGGQRDDRMDRVQEKPGRLYSRLETACYGWNVFSSVCVRHPSRAHLRMS